MPNTERKFKCYICPKAFHDKRHLKRHQVMHQQDKTFLCEICNKAFLTKVYLDRHHRTVHLSIKRHVCSECGKAFSNSGNLIAHFRIHTGLFKIYFILINKLLNKKVFPCYDQRDFKDIYGSFKLSKMPS